MAGAEEHPDIRIVGFAERRRKPKLGESPERRKVQGSEGVAAFNREGPRRPGELSKLGEGSGDPGDGCLHVLNDLRPSEILEKS